MEGQGENETASQQALKSGPPKEEEEKQAGAAGKTDLLMPSPPAHRTRCNTWPRPHQGSSSPTGVMSDTVRRVECICMQLFYLRRWA